MYTQLLSIKRLEPLVKPFCELELQISHLLAMWLGAIYLEMRVQALGQEDPPEKEMATHSSILAWEIP